MCGLFGFINYGNKMSSADLSEICNSLAEESEVRGSHATGVSFINKGKLITEKAAKSAHNMNFKIPITIAVMGHTRHSTQGSEKRNINNHPFVGYCYHKPFALAHNGVLFNDKTLRSKHKLPRTKIETDSYIAVQLIEQKGTLSFESLKYMAEQVEGSFSFTLLDHKGNLYIVKGDSPISMLHFDDLGLYIYASTDEILWKAITDTVLLKYLKSALEGKNESVKSIAIKSGEIIKVDNKGTITTDTFNYDYFENSGCNWWNFGYRTSERAETEYVDDLKAVATYLGYNSDTIAELIASGYSYEEIEELIYEGDYTEDDCGQLSYQLCGK